MNHIYALLYVWKQNVSQGTAVLAVSTQKEELRKLMLDTVKRVRMCEEDRHKKFYQIFWTIGTETEDRIDISHEIPHYKGLYEYWRWEIQTVPIIECEEEKDEISNNFGPLFLGTDIGNT